MDINKALSKLTPAERKELDALLKAPTLPNILADTFPLQRQFIEDKAKLKALFCTRRSAKSYTAGLYLLLTAIRRPGTSSVYIGLTRDQSKRIIWQDIFKAIIKKYNLPAKFNETELTISFSNGSVIYVLGVDDSEAEQDKLLGKKYALAVIDEAASYTIDLNNLIYKVLKPAMSDLGGTIVMCGTPDNRKDGIFYNITCATPVSPPAQIMKDGWKLYTWSTYDNPFMAAQWQETINELHAIDPHVDEQPWFQQHYLGKWVIEDSNKIYRYSSARNLYDGTLPDYGFTNWQYVLGIDLGFSDCTALVLLAYHEHDPYTYIVQSDKWKGLTISDTADKIRLWMSEYPINHFIVDGANKQGVEEMVRHHQLPLEAADKHDKLSFIRIMNSDFISGKIKVMAGSNDKLIEEYDKAVWQRKALERGIYKEDYSFHPDAADAALYAYRYTYAYTSTGRPLTDAYKESIVNAYDRDTLDTLERFSRERAERQEAIFGNEYLYD